MKKTVSPTIDVLKFIFAICIVGIHTRVLINTSEVVQWYVTHLLFRLGVPFFFCVSGYFLGYKLWGGCDYKESFSNYRKRLLPPLIVWGGLGLLQYAVELYIKGENLIIIRLLRTMIFYPKGAMWYVWACIVATYILQFFWNKKYRNVWIWGIGIVGYAFALIANTYYFIVEDTVIGKIVELYLRVCVSARNGIFVGVIFLWIGITLAHLNMNEKIPNRIGYIFLIALVLYVIEVYYTFGKNVADDSALFVAHLVLIPSGIVLALKCNIKNNIFAKEFRRMSTCIYFTHAFINNLLGYILPYGVIRFVVVLSICLIIYFIQMKCNNKYLAKIV